jgi:hypothetical protein
VCAVLARYMNYVLNVVVTGTYRNHWYLVQVARLLLILGGCQRSGGNKLPQTFLLEALVAATTLPAPVVSR